MDQVHEIDRLARVATRLKRENDELRAELDAVQEEYARAVKTGVDIIEQNAALLGRLRDAGF